VTSWTEQLASRFLSAVPWYKLQAEWRAQQFLLPGLKSSMLSFFLLRFIQLQCLPAQDFIITVFYIQILATCTLRINDFVKLPYQPQILRTQFSSRSCFTYCKYAGVYTECPTRYRNRHFFNNSETNEDIVTKFEQEYVRCVRNEEECVCSVCL
jgi:hypothetical protein